MATLNPIEGSSTPTQDLLKNYTSEFIRATRAPFLKAAGSGGIDSKTLSRWLSQDRLYGQAYISFIGSLLGHTHLPTAYDREHKTLQWRIVEMLTGAMQNILREQKFYDDVMKRYELSPEEPPAGHEAFAALETTQSYVDLFRSFLNPEKSLLEGIVVLWATEKCYLEAWSYALESQEGASDTDLDGGALRIEFIPNWTSKEFLDFVDSIAGLLNELAMESGGFDHASLKVWKDVLKLEEMFWPEI